MNKVKLLIALLFLSSCVPTFSCDEWANSFRDDEEFALILTKKENGGRDAYFYGIDLKTKEKTEFYDGSGWISRNIDQFDIGDTVIKYIGKYTITIKRSGKIFTIPFRCSGKIYTDK